MIEVISLETGISMPAPETIVMSDDWFGLYRYVLFYTMSISGADNMIIEIHDACGDVYHTPDVIPDKIRWFHIAHEKLVEKGMLRLNAPLLSLTNEIFQDEQLDGVQLVRKVVAEIARLREILVGLDFNVAEIVVLNLLGSLNTQDIAEVIGEKQRDVSKKFSQGTKAMHSILTEKKLVNSDSNE